MGEVRLLASDSEGKHGERHPGERIWGAEQQKGGAKQKEVSPEQ